MSYIEVDHYLYVGRWPFEVVNNVLVLLHAESTKE